MLITTLLEELCYPDGTKSKCSSPILIARSRISTRAVVRTCVMKVIFKERYGFLQRAEISWPAKLKDRDVAGGCCANFERVGLVPQTLSETHPVNILHEDFDSRGSLQPGD